MSPRPPAFRLLVTEPADAAWNMALDAVLLAGSAGGEGRTSPPTIRLLGFEPRAVLVGAYQRVEDEVRLEYCRDQGIDVSRRLTGGGAIFFDRTQVGWEIVCRFEDLGLPGRPSGDLGERLSRPLIEALGSLGVDARYRPRNDIEVRGRKISGTGGTDEHGALLFQGTLLVDFDVETMVRALRVPVEKLRRQEIDGLRDRVTWLGRELDEVPDRATIHGALEMAFAQMLAPTPLVPGPLLDQELEALEEALPRFRSEEYVLGRTATRQDRGGGRLLKSLFPTESGVLKVLVRTGRDPRRILAARIDGDFFCSPRRALYDLEAQLKGVHRDRVREEVEGFFRTHDLEIAGMGPDAIAASLLEALERAEGDTLGLGTEQVNSVFPLGGRFQDLASLAPRALLLPYCARPLECESRHQDTCDGCGECAFGRAVELGEAAGLEVTSITSFEHLMGTLEGLRDRGDASFVGSCCEAFFIKHRLEMESLGVPGLLFDVVGSETCYDLGKAAYAYAGEYDGETSVDLELLGTLLASKRGAA